METCSMEDFGARLTGLLEEEARQRREALDEALARRAAALKRDLAAGSPRETGAYAAGWRLRTAMRNHEKVRILSNGAKPQLTHLLEYGTRRQQPRPHIRPAVERAVQELERELK